MNDTMEDIKFKMDAIDRLKKSFAYTIITSKDDGEFHTMTNVGLKLIEMYFSHNPKEWEKLINMVENHDCGCRQNHKKSTIN